MELQKYDSMSSLELSSFTGKRHADVLRDIKKMAPSWEKVTQRKFALSEYVDKTGRKLPVYNLTKREVLFVVSKYNDELRAKIIIMLEDLTEKNIALIKINNERLNSYVNDYESRLLDEKEDQFGII